MFGFFLGLFDLGVFIHGSLKNDTEKSTSKQKAISLGKLTYNDMFGRTYYVKNDRRVVNNGKQIYDVKTGEIYIDIEYEKRIEEINKKKEEKRKHEENNENLIYKALSRGEKYVEVKDYNGLTRRYRTKDKREFGFKPREERAGAIPTGRNYAPNNLIEGYYDKQFKYFCDVEFNLYNNYYTDQNLLGIYKCQYLPTIEYNNVMFKKYNNIKFVEKNNIPLTPLSEEEFIKYVRRGNKL